MEPPINTTSKNVGRKVVLIAPLYFVTLRFSSLNERISSFKDWTESMEDSRSSSSSTDWLNHDSTFEYFPTFAWPTQ